VVNYYNKFIGFFKNLKNHTPLIDFKQLAMGTAWGAFKKWGREFLKI
jgi:hypothetical protein